ncbi:hypothetical protein TNCT_649911 [Trichonephila clavata]|uniref:Uncharacterized protein n=1 Tax=Trichonephila clavata TaxID=2740835 RepID=A0A8X6G5E1_TRICU|nr:hypothetical protein TNCT_649911 [Trichonephila clavata]
MNIDTIKATHTKTMYDNFPSFKYKNKSEKNASLPVNAIHCTIKLGHCAPQMATLRMPVSCFLPRRCRIPSSRVDSSVANSCRLFPRNVCAADHQQRNFLR